MATANDIMDAAYIKCGIRSPDSTDDAEALLALNNMIGSWSADIIIPVVVREGFDLIIGTRNYTIGSGGDFDTARPLSVVNISLRDLDSYNYPIKLISGKDWDAIHYKESSGKPATMYYLPEYPLGVLRFNKKPDKAYSIKLESNKHLTEFASKDTTVSLPNEYKEALIYNLAIRLAENNSIELSPSVLTLAQVAYLGLSRLTAINRMSPIARFDFGAGKPFNIITGE